jgi:hypothetical protein
LILFLNFFPSFPLFVIFSDYLKNQVSVKSQKALLIFFETFAFANRFSGCYQQ